MSDTPLGLPSSWSGIFDHRYTREQHGQLERTIFRLYESEAVYPPRVLVFEALSLVPPEQTKVVILGQDPYPTKGKAHGLSFSVMKPHKPPASLRNIFRELERSIPGWSTPDGGDLRTWARQGVLLLNTILTVRAGAPLSHSKLGWEEFSQAVIRHVQSKSKFVIFVLWGGNAKRIAIPWIDQDAHTILGWSHPSPLSENRLPPEKRFVGNNHFVEANAALISRGCPPIDWRL